MNIIDSLVDWPAMERRKVRQMLTMMTACLFFGAASFALLVIVRMMAAYRPAMMAALRQDCRPAPQVRPARRIRATRAGGGLTPPRLAPVRAAA